jgi:hypothetical protein
MPQCSGKSISERRQSRLKQGKARRKASKSGEAEEAMCPRKRRSQRNLISHSLPFLQWHPFTNPPDFSLASLNHTIIRQTGDKHAFPTGVDTPNHLIMDQRRICVSPINGIVKTCTLGGLKPRRGNL